MKWRRHDGKIIAWELALRGKPRWSVEFGPLCVSVVGRGWTVGFAERHDMTRRRFNLVVSVGTHRGRRGFVL